MGFTTFNVWLDVAFVVLYVCVVLFLTWHFTMFVITGRFRKSFIEGNWPSHDHIPPVTPKLLHATHMFSMIFLGISGMYIRFPFFFGGRTFMRWTHYIFMMIVIVVLVWRIWYAFRSKTNADWREFAIGRKDLATAIGVLKYYGYLSNEKPHVAKYNVLQKMSYNMFLYMMFAQAFTGLALVTAPFLFGFSPRDLLVGWWLGQLAGGTDLAGWGVRTVHYILNWLFIIMSTVHLYLAFTVDVPCALDFFGVKPLQIEPGAHGQGHGHGHGSHDGHETVTPLPVEPAM